MPNRVVARLSAAYAFLILSVLLLWLLVPSLIAPYDPLTPNAALAFQAPSVEHPLGTDQVGRDVLSRIIFGARSSVLVGLCATLVAVALGGFIGTSAAMLPRAARFTLRRGTEVLMVLPELLLALFVIALVGPGVLGVFIALSLAAIPAYANVSRTTAIVTRGSESVQAATVIGLSPTRIFFRYILVETAQPLAALAALGIGVMILTAAGLSYLGLGVQAPTPDWGVMLAESSDYFARAWWLMVFPGATLTTAVLAFSLLGRALQRRLR